MRHVELLIVGAGPTGLGAAARLHQHGHADWLLLEAESGPGGLARTVETPEGFLFDYGGHVMFSHFAFFDDLLDAATGRTARDAAVARRWERHERKSHVLMPGGELIPYPFQNNVGLLRSAADREACIADMRAAQRAAGEGDAGPPANFDEWVERAMGRRVADLFMRPYNRKVWATPLHAMSSTWIADRVAVPDVDRIAANAAAGRADPGWGPNATFRFPATRGTGGMWADVAALLPASRVQYRSKVVALDLERKVACVATVDAAGRPCQREVSFGRLLATAPLDATLRAVGRPDLAAPLRRTSTHIVGVGLRGLCPHGDACWMYSPDPECPFYRITFFSKYADGNVPPAAARLPTKFRAGDADAGAVPASADVSAAEPEPGPYWSLMLEVSEAPPWAEGATEEETLGESGASVTRLARACIRHCVRLGLCPAEAEVVSLSHHRLENGYPVPFLGRDELLQRALPWLQERQVWSRGRFGAWRYEVSNQDHSVMQGVEAVDAMLFGKQETTLWANGAGRSDELRYA